MIPFGGYTTPRRELRQVQQKEAIEKLLKDNRKSKTWLSEGMGYNRPTAISNMLARGNMALDTLCRICELLEYEVTIQPRRKSGVRPNGQIVIDRREEK